jgi:putative acetyltransferase
LILSVATRAEQITAVMILRGMVFMEEQGIAYADEIDAHDGEALHVLGTVQNEPVAVARMRFVQGWAKFERIAVRRSYRGRGYGRTMVDFLIGEACRRDYPRCRMHAQAHLQEFYARHGFYVHGSPFEEAGIAHVCMLRDAQPPLAGVEAARWRIEPLTLGDHAAVHALWRASRGIGVSAADRRDAMARYLTRNPALSCVARLNDEVLGAVLCGHDGRRGYLHHLAVLPAWRGQGIGRALVGHALAALGQAGIEKSHVFLLADNEEGQRFWQRIGWQKRRELRVASRQIAATDGNATAPGACRPLPR